MTDLLEDFISNYINSQEFEELCTKQLNLGLKKKN